MRPFVIERVWGAGKPVAFAERGSTLALLVEATVRPITVAATSLGGCPAAAARARSRARPVCNASPSRSLTATSRNTASSGPIASAVPPTPPRSWPPASTVLSRSASARPHAAVNGGEAVS
jgi:hypothetical protein